jgi:hypothetical protein
MLTSSRARWARTRLTPFCLTWGERAAPKTEPAGEEAVDEAKTSPRLKSGPILLASQPKREMRSSS